MSYHLHDLSFQAVHSLHTVGLVLRMSIQSFRWILVASPQRRALIAGEKDATCAAYPHFCRKLPGCGFLPQDPRCKHERQLFTPCTRRGTSKSESIRSGIDFTMVGPSLSWRQKALVDSLTQWARVGSSLGSVLGVVSLSTVLVPVVVDHF